MPYSVGHRRTWLQLQAGMLPQGTGLVPVQRGNGIACALAVQHLRALQRHRQRIVAKQQQVLRRVRVGKQVERQAAGLRIPERVPVVSFARQPLRADIVAHAAAVVGLGQLEAAEPDSLLFRLHRVPGFRAGSLNPDIGCLPVGFPVCLLRAQCFLKGSLPAFRQGIPAPAPQFFPFAAVEQDHRALFHAHGLSLLQADGARPAGRFCAGLRGKPAGNLQDGAGKRLLPGQRRAGLQHQRIRICFGTGFLPEAFPVSLMRHVKAQPGGYFRIAREIQRLQRNPLVRPFPVHHIHKPQERQPEFLSGFRLPGKAPLQGPGTHVQLPPEVPEPHLPQVQLLAVQRDVRHQPFRRGDHEMGMVDNPPVGTPELLDIIDSVDVRAAEAVHASAFVKAPAHAHALIRQGKNGFADPGIGRVKPLLNNLPRIHPEIPVCCLCHA